MDIRRNAVHFIVYMLFCMTAISCAAYLTSLKGTTIQVTIQYGTKLFELVAIEIGGLGKARAGQERRNNLRHIVELHQMALRFTKHLESTVTFMLINQILNCILIWCLMMFYLSTVGFFEFEVQHRSYMKNCYQHFRTSDPMP